jgi:hypothetical protein
LQTLKETKNQAATDWFAKTSVALETMVGVSVESPQPTAMEIGDAQPLCMHQQINSSDDPDSVLLEMMNGSTSPLHPPT